MIEANLIIVTPFAGTTRLDAKFEQLPRLEELIVVYVDGDTIKAKVKEITHYSDSVPFSCWDTELFCEQIFS